MTIRLYGISNCDTVKKAIKYLDENAVEFEFVDFKKKSPTKAEIELWAEFYRGLPLNPKSRTFRQVKDEYEKCSYEQKIAFLQTETSLIKRPILMKGKQVLAFGFHQEDYARALKL